MSLTIVHEHETSIESGQAAYHEMMRQQPQVTAIGAVNDSMAIGAMRAARTQGRVIPVDLSIVGFDDIAWAALHDPPLTTVRIPRQQMGKEAAHRILLMLQDAELLAAEIVVPVTLVERASVAGRR